MSKTVKAKEPTVEELVEIIATGKREPVSIHRKDLKHLLHKISAKYHGVVVFFGFGSTMHVQRERKKPMEPKKTQPAAA